MNEKTFPQDAGATVADELTSLCNWGVCQEADFPYTQNPSAPITPQMDTAAWPNIAYCAAHIDLTDPTGIQQVLAQGKPVVIGMPVYESFETTGSDGMVPLPNTATEKLLGGHAVVIVGYTDGQRWIVRNSWGTGWGDGGYCYLPFSLTPSFLEAWTASNSIR